MCAGIIETRHSSPETIIVGSGWPMLPAKLPRSPDRVPWGGMSSNQSKVISILQSLWLEVLKWAKTQGQKWQLLLRIFERLSRHSWGVWEFIAHLPKCCLQPLRKPISSLMLLWKSQRRKKGPQGLTSCWFLPTEVLQLASSMWGFKETRLSKASTVWVD